MSFATHIRETARRLSREELPKLIATVWGATVNGGLSEEEASQLDGELRLLQKARPEPRRSPRPRTQRPESIQRRRMLSSSGAMPPEIANHFTQAERAALTIIAREVQQHGRCTKTIGEIAARAGVCETIVRNALREASRMKLLQVQERRLTRWRSLPNIVTIIAPNWVGWLRLRPRGGGGCRFVRPTENKSINLETPKRVFDRFEGYREVPTASGPPRRA
jgi:hypothetical protein